LSASSSAAEWTGGITVRGTASIGGKEVVREARAASVTWPVAQANVNAIARLDRSLVLGVRGPAPYSLLAEADPAPVKAGAKVTVPSQVGRASPDVKGPLQVTAANLPGALTFQPLTVAPGSNRVEAVLTVKPNADPGVYTVVLRGQAQVNGVNPK